MTDWAAWFRQRLQTSGEDFMWAFSRIYPALHKSLPPNPRYLGLWAPARHVWHVTEYERCIALPIMRQWLGGSPLPDDDDVWPDSDELWLAVSDQPAEAYHRAFWDVRQQQIALLDSFSPASCDEKQDTGWGPKPLSMVVTKTYQHTFEHADTLLRMGLWWADMALEEAKHAAQS